MPASETSSAPTAVEAVALATAIQRNLRSARDEIEEARDSAEELLNMVMHIRFERFNHAVIQQADSLREDLIANSGFFVETQKQVHELLELIEYADRKDG